MTGVAFFDIDSFQLEKGVVATEYERPAPAPDYPIEIHSLNDFDVVSSTKKLSEGQLEEYDYDTEYENIDKINLLLDEPLRSIGDVKDRLFRDSDGLWKIERNVAQYISDGNESWRLQSAAQNRWDMTSNNLPINSIYDSNNNATTPVLNSHFIETRGSAVEGGTYVFVKNVRIYWAKPTSVDDLKSMLKSYHDNGNPVTWHYQIRPTIETLNQELQDKLNNLRSFEDSNYVYTVINDKTDIISENLKPTLHATFKGGGWYSRWKTEDELEKHQANIDEKANQSDTEVRLNEIASELLVKQQEIEAAATAGELDAFVKKYNQEQEAFAKEKQASEDALASAQDAIDLITNKMDNMAETWEFFDEYIKFEEGSIVLGNETEGSHVRIHNDRISFYNSGYEVASITQGKMTIEAGTFVEEIQISEFKFQKSSNGHLTVRYVG